MCKKPMTSWLASFLKRKSTKEALIISVIVIVLLVGIFLLYEWLCQPIVALLLGSPKTYQGIDLYHSGEYLQYQGGADFRDAVDHVDFLEDVEEEEFYYSDNSYFDNLFYGEMMDFYSIKYSAGNQYDLLKETVIQQGDYCGMLYGSDTGYIYQMEQPLESPGVTLIVFDDTEQLLSLIYIYGANEDTLISGSLLFQHSHIGWVMDHIEKTYGTTEG